MNSQFRPQTAQILQFPPPGARERLGRQNQAIAKQKTAVMDFATSVCAGSWYHDAAISEAERPQKA